MPDTALRGPYADAAGDYSIAQDMAAYSAAGQAALLGDHAAAAYRDGLAQLGGGDSVPELARASARLGTGWSLVGVPGLIPERNFFTHLAARRFPVTTWIRRPEECDYVVEPDIFHDFQGHKPLLAQPDFAAFLAAYGAAGRDAADWHLAPLARLYWHMVEFGLIRQAGGLRAYGAGILSSRAETLHATGRDARRLRFDLPRVLRSEYVIDRLQPVYFVIDDFAELFDALAALPVALASLGPPIPAGASTALDQPL